MNEGFEIGQRVVYDMGGGRSLKAVVVNVTTKRVVIKPDGLGNRVVHAKMLKACQDVDHG